MVALGSVKSKEDCNSLHRLLSEHLSNTSSANAERVLSNWDAMLPKFIKIMPHDYKRALAENANLTLSMDVSLDDFSS